MNAPHHPLGPDNPITSSSNDETRSLFDRFANQFDRPPLDFWSMLGKRLVTLADIAPGEHVLDVGSGTGAVAMAAAAATYPEGSVLGIDIAPAMVTTAQQRAREANVPGLRYLEADAATFVPGRRFDAILGGFSLFFLPNMEDALWRFRQWTMPHGRWAFSFWAERGFPPLGEILLQDLATEIPTLPDEIEAFRHRFANPIVLMDLLGSFGGRTSLISEAPSYRVASLEQWWLLANHSGLRAFIDRIQPDRREAVKQRHFAHIEDSLGRNNCFTIKLPTHFATVRFD
ncbi:class I SAM-dependent methyltransferase [Dyella soli]